MNGMVKNGILFGAGLIVFFLAFSAATNFSAAGGQSIASSANPHYGNTGASESAATGDVQAVKVTFKNSRYIFTPAQLRKGAPVRLEFEMSQIGGCMRSVVISALAIRKTLSESDNTITFTPIKAGTFNIACSMNMGKGTFTVVESDGTVSDYIEPKGAAPAGGGCGCCGGSAAGATDNLPLS